MGWSIGYDSTWHRDIGYGVPATCDHPGCMKKIDRGLAHVCGSDPYGGDHGCGLYFCDEHLLIVRRGEHEYHRTYQLCERCVDGDEPFDPTEDTRKWVMWKLLNASWKEWRGENPEEVEALRRLHTKLRLEARNVDDDA